MGKLLIVILSLIVFPLSAQEDSKVSEFHRLLIFNAQNELMVVKIKNTNFWVTPGLYSEKNTQLSQSLHALAAEYGLTISQPLLRGVFVLKNQKTDIDANRSFFHANVTGGESKVPDNIEAVTWLPIVDAMDLITFPHINMLIKQLAAYPKVTWGGTILRYQQGKELKSKMIKDFFPLGDS